MTLHTVITNSWTQSIRVSLALLAIFARRRENILHTGGTGAPDSGLTNALPPTCRIIVPHVQYGIVRSVAHGLISSFEWSAFSVDHKNHPPSGQHSLVFDRHHFIEKFSGHPPPAFNLDKAGSFNGFARSNIVLSHISN